MGKVEGLRGASMGFALGAPVLSLVSEQEVILTFGMGFTSSSHCSKCWLLTGLPAPESGLSGIKGQGRTTIHFTWHIFISHLLCASH